MKGFLSTVALLSSVTFAAGQSCTLPTTCTSTTYSYAPEPCFPNTGVCYPTNYYAAQDQGQFSSSNGAFAAQLSAKCEATCSAQSQCASYAGTINAAPDGKLATGTCFLYSVKQIYPRQCADAPTGIVASYKQYVCPTSSTTTTTTKSTTTKSTTTKSTTTKSTTTTTKPTTTSTSTTTTTTTTKPTTTSTSTTTTSTTTTTPSTTTTTTTSTTTTTTTTTTAAPTPTFQPCNSQSYGNNGGPGAGGCPIQCYCDHDTSGREFCEDASQCGSGCNSDSDCPTGTMCTDSYQVECGRNTCLDSSSCVIGSSKRSLGTRGDQSWKYWEKMRMEAKRATELHPSKAVA